MTILFGKPFEIAGRKFVLRDMTKQDVFEICGYPPEEAKRLAEEPYTLPIITERHWALLEQLPPMPANFPKKDPPRD